MVDVQWIIFIAARIPDERFDFLREVA